MELRFLGDPVKKNLTENITKKSQGFLSMFYYQTFFWSSDTLICFTEPNNVFLKKRLICWSMINGMTALQPNTEDKNIKVDISKKKLHSRQQPGFVYICKTSPMIHPITYICSDFFFFPIPFCHTKALQMGVRAPPIWEKSNLFLFF